MSKTRAVEAWAVVNEAGQLKCGGVLTDYTVTRMRCVARSIADYSRGQRVIRVRVVPVERKKK